ncbi:hypothetical protein RGF97_05910 [Streptomyces roseicoloratus]|uniref:Protein kinase domain-containing protein n=1 Tax=Streptomyces roseicoloratus TaxID=2508722 RepID=A0ABY9RTC8_9ACTN|nr:hypothetical protein [Streptomyces roseicoloratus]WMX44489.1 hypothetical protein RGF97_05910 [Streptomyces roseicoloratus]
MKHPGADDARRIGPYALLERQGTAGGNDVFTARTDAGRLVTVTVVRSELAADPGFRDRFRAAVEAARTPAAAPFLAPVVDADSDAPLPWLATEFTAGLPLRHAVDRHGPLSEPALRVLADGLGRALAALHATGTVHGEVSPDSVLLTMDGPRVSALGIAGGTGSPAPAATDDMVDLGSTVLFAASGGEPDLGALPVSLREVIGGCLYPEPPDRPTAQQLVDYLARQNLPTLQGSWLPPSMTADMAAAAAAAGSASVQTHAHAAPANHSAGAAHAAPAAQGGSQAAQAAPGGNHAAQAAHGGSPSAQSGQSAPCDPPPAPGLLLPPPVIAADRGVSRRKLIIGLAGGAAVLGGSAAALAFSGDPSPTAGGRAGGPGATARPASRPARRRRPPLLPRRRPRRTDRNRSS